MYRLILLVAASSLFISGCLLAERYGLAERTTGQQQVLNERCLAEIKQPDLNERMDASPEYKKWMYDNCADFLKKEEQQ